MAYNTDPNDCTITLEVGHGPYMDYRGTGWEPGASGPGINEWEAVTSQARKIKELLDPLGYTVKIVDKALTLSQLGAQGAGSNIFVSLHLNAFNQQAQGSEVLVHPSGTTLDKVLGRSILSEIVAALKLPNRGVKEMRLAVLGAVPPSVEAAVLVESFFIDSVKDRETVLSLNDKAAEATAKGLHFYWSMTKDWPG